MKFKEFMESLDREIKHINLLVGKETFYIDKAREKILSRLNVDRAEIVTIDCDAKPPLGEIISAIDSAPFFAEKNVVLVKNAAFLGAETKSDRLIQILQDMQETNFVIFTAQETDKRRKIFRIISDNGAILEADPLRPWEIDGWLDDKLKSLGKFMYGEARRHFSERVGILPEISLWYLDNELNKIALTVPGNEITAEDLRRGMLNPPEVANYALTDAINARRTKKAVYLLRTQIRDPRKIPLITTILVSHIRQLLRAQFFIRQGIKGRRLGEPLELNPYIAQKVGEIAPSYPPKLLEEIFLELADADYKLKTGRANAEILERIVIKLCQR